MNLGEPQKKYLRGLGHRLKASIMVGDAGLSDPLRAEFESTLAHHELIKVKLRVGDRATREKIITKLCTDHAATLIQRIGNVALLYRANPQKQPAKRLRMPSK